MLLEARNLAIGYGDAPAVWDVSLGVQKFPYLHDHQVWRTFTPLSKLRINFVEDG